MVRQQETSVISQPSHGLSELSEHSVTYYAIHLYLYWKLLAIGYPGNWNKLVASLNFKPYIAVLQIYLIVETRRMAHVSETGIKIALLLILLLLLSSS